MIKTARYRDNDGRVYPVAAWGWLRIAINLEAKKARGLLVAYETGAAHAVGAPPLPGSQREYHAEGEDFDRVFPDGDFLAGFWKLAEERVDAQAFTDDGDLLTNSQGKPKLVSLFR